jgi:hypothetical protein
MLADKFCKDFACCGKQLTDLHDLLQHFEENHVSLEPEMDIGEDELQFDFDGMDVDAEPRNSVALSDIYSDNLQTSCFETSVRKKPIKTWPKQISPPMPYTIPLNEQGPTHVLDDQEQVIAVNPSSPTASESIDKTPGGRPYGCKIAGCTKAYKNPGGLKYHMQHGHCQDTGDPEMNNIIHKPYQCTVPDCGKRYKNLNGLKVNGV